MVTDKNSYESATGHQSESRKLQSGDVSYEESSRKAASKAKLEMDGITAQKAAAVEEVRTCYQNCIPSWNHLAISINKISPLI